MAFLILHIFVVLLSSILLICPVLRITLLTRIAVARRHCLLSGAKQCLVFLHRKIAAACLMQLAVVHIADVAAGDRRLPGRNLCSGSLLLDTLLGLLRIAGRFAARSFCCHGAVSGISLRAAACGSIPRGRLTAIISRVLAALTLCPWQLTLHLAAACGRTARRLTRFPALGRRAVLGDLTAVGNCHDRTLFVASEYVHAHGAQIVERLRMRMAITVVFSAADHRISGIHSL